MLDGSGRFRTGPSPPTAYGGGKMFFEWTPNRIRIAIYFMAAYMALC